MTQPHGSPAARRPRRRRVLASALLCAMAAAPLRPSAAQGIPAGDQGELIRRVLPAVVTITVRKETGKAQAGSNAAASAPPEDKTEYGSGFVVDPSGVIVTNYHVVEDAWDVIVGFSDGTRVPARLVKASRLVDVALLKVAVGHDLPVVAWGDSDRLLVGEPVIAIGNPFGVGISAAAGIVSALNRDISDSPYDDFIQTDAAINHGNSGGPLFDLHGDVVGMDTALISPTKAASGLGFAIPSRSTRTIIARLEAYGWLRPGWVGMKVQQISVGLGRAFGLPKAMGSIVASVTPAGPADKAGLAVGDIIMTVGGATPTDERALLRQVATTEIGAALPIGILREGHPQALSIAVAEWPREQWDLVDRPVQMPPFHQVAPDLGLSLATATGESMSRFGIADPRPGVLVTGVVAGSDAADRGLEAGDIIMRVTSQDVAAPADVAQGIAAARAAGRDFIAVLVWPKVRAKPGPTWLALRVTGT